MIRITKSQLAEAAGVSLRTLQRWMVGHRSMLTEMGYQPRSHFFSPKVTRYICHEYGIDIEDLPQSA